MGMRVRADAEIPAVSVRVQGFWGLPCCSNESVLGHAVLGPSRCLLLPRRTQASGDKRYRM